MNDPAAICNAVASVLDILLALAILRCAWAIHRAVVK